MIKHLYMVFDVESVGLHGEGFWVGWVVTDRCRILSSGSYCCDPRYARGNDEGREWIAKNIPLPVGTVNCEEPRQVRDAFWLEWVKQKNLGATLVTDCGWPVEARFLNQCVDDGNGSREWTGPYPLHDVATLIAARGGDPTEKRHRWPEELPEHNPMCDARQSARLWVENLPK